MNERNGKEKKPRPKRPEGLHHDLRAEAKVLAYVITYPEFCEQALAHVATDDFIDPFHQKIYQSIIQWIQAGGSADQVASCIDHIYHSTKHLSENAAKDLFTICEIAKCITICWRQDARYWLKVLLNVSQRRAMQLATARLAEAADADDPVAECESLFQEITKRPHGVLGESMIGTEVFDTLNDMEHQRDGRSSKFISSGYPHFDEMFGGFHRGDNVVLAASTGIGKTAFALSVAAHNAERGKSVFYLCLEMKRDELHKRILSQLSRVDMRNIFTGYYSRDERKRMADAAVAMGQWKFCIADDSDLNVRQAFSRIQTFKDRHGLDLLVVDYLSLLRPDNPKASRYEQVTQLSRSVQQLAKKVDAATINIVQLNREYLLKGTKPTMKNLRDSGAIEQDANLVVILHRPSTESPELEIDVAKNRNGPRGQLKMIFDGSTQTFSDCESTL